MQLRKLSAKNLPVENRPDRAFQRTAPAQRPASRRMLSSGYVPIRTAVSWYGVKSELKPALCVREIYFKFSGSEKLGFFNLNNTSVTRTRRVQQNCANNFEYFCRSIARLLTQNLTDHQRATGIRCPHRSRQALPAAGFTPQPIQHPRIPGRSIHTVDTPIVGTWLHRRRWSCDRKAFSSLGVYSETKESDLE